MGTCCEEFGEHRIVFVSIHATYCVIIAGASPGETKMWAAVRENGDFLQVSRVGPSVNRDSERIYACSQAQSARYTCEIREAAIKPKTGPARPGHVNITQVAVDFGQTLATLNLGF